MNKRIAALLSVLIAVMMLFGACAVKETEETATASASPEPAENPIVAEVNGEPIYYDQYYTIFASACAQYGVAEDDETNSSYIKSMVIESLINEKIMTQKLTENGYMDLTDEQAAEVQQTAQDEMNNLIDNYYGETIQAELGEGFTEEQYAQARAAYEDEALTAIGYTKDEFADIFKLSMAQDNAFNALVGDIVPTEEEVKAKYEESVATDQEAMDANASTYESNVMNGVTVYYVPAGVRQVRQVLIQIDDGWSSAINSLREAGNDVQAEYLLEKALADIKGEADDVLDKIKSGSITFADAIATYNDDPGMPETGYSVVPGGTSFVEPFTTAAMGLAAIGDVSELVPTDYGYHIIEYSSDVTPGAVAYDGIRQQLYDSLLTSMQDEAWQTIIAEWTSESSIVKNEDNM